MATVMWQHGRRLFSSAAVLMILTALAHTAGQFGPSIGVEEEKLLTAMNNFRISLGFGMNPSMLEIHKSLAFTMTVTFIALGIINLLISGSRDATNQLMLRVTCVNVVWVGAFGVLSAIYHIPPPLISAFIIEAVLLTSFALSLRRLRS